MKFLTSFILLTFFSAFAQNEYPIKSTLGTLVYNGNYVSTNELMDKIIISYPRLINFSINPNWKPSYPNPGSPSESPPSTFVLYDTSDLLIELLDEHELKIIDFACSNNPNGYYTFHINWLLPSIDSLHFQPRESNLRFIINDTTYTVPLIPY